MSSEVSPLALTLPLATADQHAVEAAALGLLNEPIVQAAIADTAQFLKASIPHGPLTAARFDQDYPQAVFSALMGAANADPERPRVHAVGLFAHKSGELDVPGTKAMHPNPDYVYRMIPVDGVGRYVLHGRKPAHGPLAFEVSLMGEGGATLGNLSLSDIAITADGAFAITIDPAAADGRPNHLQSHPGARQLLIRDIFDKIAIQRPMALSIERLDPPSGPAKTTADILATIAPVIRGFISGLLGIARVLGSEPNRLQPPTFQNQSETLVTQAYSIGHFRLAPDEGLLIRLTLGSAAYAVVPATSYWGGIGDFLRHRASIGTGRAEPDPDGGYTFVVAGSDPGVANWVDTGGLDEGVLCVRWLGFAPGAGPMPELTARVVPLAELDAALPAGTPRCDPDDRRAQLEAHVRDYTAWERN